MVESTIKLHGPMLNLVGLLSQLDSKLLFLTVPLEEAMFGLEQSVYLHLSQVQVELL